MKKILAVSGGIDSMVLLDIFKHERGVVVAHFNHGLRLAAAADEALVARRAEELGLPFVSARVELKNAAEATAREARYAFLRRVAAREQGVIYTAHHEDDVLESVAINLCRGTGWRGLVPMANRQLVRPFLDLNYLPASALIKLKLSKGELVRKQNIYQYAASQKLVFRQDETNTEAQYLRNRLRVKLRELDAGARRDLAALYLRQKELKTEIEQVVAELLPADGYYWRKWFEQMDEGVALELLRAALLKAGAAATRLKLKEFLGAICTYAPAKYFNLPEKRLVKLEQKYFQL